MPRRTFCDHDNSPGAHRCQNCGAGFLGQSGPIPGLQDALERQGRALLAEGRKIEAIRVYTEATEAGPKEAKDAVEAVQRGQVLALTGLDDASEWGLQPSEEGFHEPIPPLADLPGRHDRGPSHSN